MCSVTNVQVFHPHIRFVGAVCDRARCLRLILTFLVATCPVLVSQDRNGSVSGTVVNTYTQAPVSGVNIQIPGIAQSETDETGRFRIVNVPPGRYMLQAVRSGMTAVPSGRSSETIIVASGEDVRDVRLQMAPFGVVRGHIRDDRGNPLPGVSVQAMVLSYQQGRRVFKEPSLAAGILNSSAETDENGEYRLELPSGAYYVLGQMRSPEVRDESAVRVLGGAQKIYYPGTPEAAFATPVEVRGETAGVDFVLAAALATHKVYVRVEGIAQASRNFMPAGAQIAELRDRFSLERFPIVGPLSRGGGPASQGMVIDAVPNGSYDLYIDGVMEGGARGRGMTSIDMRGEDLHDVVVALQPAQDIAGRVAGADSAKQISFSGLTVVLGNRSVSVDPNGVFVIPAVLTGSYPVTVEGLPAETYIADIRYGGNSLHETAHNVNGPELEAGLSGTPLQILVATNGGAIDGVVEQREAAAGATIVLVPNSSRRFIQSYYKTTLAGPAGSFSFRGVPPGVYQLFAWESVPDTAWLNPEFMTRWEGRGQVVSVEAGGSVNVRLRLFSKDD